MKKVLIAAVIASFALAAIGCHGQLPVTQHTVTLTVTSTIPAGSTFVASKLSVASGTTTCPVSTGSNYTPINASSPSTTGTIIDTTSAGQTVCEGVQLLSGGATSPFSNIVGPYVVPANPTAPVISGQAAMTATADDLKRLAKEREMLKPRGDVKQPELVARVN